MVFTLSFLLLFSLGSYAFATSGPFAPGAEINPTCGPTDPNCYVQLINSLNGDTSGTQTFAVGTSGTDFAVSTSSGVHTFNLPNASATARGAISTGAQTIAGAKTFSDALVDSANGVASTPATTLTGTWFTGGSTTTTKPQLLIEPSGTTSSNWSTSGTGLGVNGASGFAGSLFDLKVAGASKFTVDASGNISYGGGNTFISMSAGRLNSGNGSTSVDAANRALSDGVVGTLLSWSNPTVVINPATNADKGLIVRGVSGQTADLQQWQNSSSSTLAFIDATGALGLGVATTAAKTHVVSTTEQLRLGYDASNYLSVTVGSTGGVTFDATGSGAGFNFSDPLTGNDNGAFSPASNVLSSVRSVGQFGGGITFKDGSGYSGIWTDSSGARLNFNAGGTSSGFGSQYGTMIVTSSAVGIGLGSGSPSAKLHTISTTEQLRLGFDASTYTSFTVTSGSGIKITPSSATATYAIGNNANASSIYSVALGYSATASGNGAYALGRESTSGGNFSLALGYASTTNNQYAAALTPVSTANFDYSVAIGYASATTAANQIRLGTASYDTSIPGTLTVQNITVGKGPGTIATNTAMGYQVLNSNTTGYQMTAIGYQAMYSHTSGGDDNVAVGYQALYTNNSWSNVAVGSEALKLATANGDVGVGHQAGSRKTLGANNIFIGTQSGYSYTGNVSNNVAVGAGALGGTTSASSVSGNTAVGYQALTLASGGPNNAFGYLAGSAVTTGSSNTYLGSFTGTGFETSSNRIFLSDADGNMRVHINNSGDMGVGTSTNTVSARIHAIKTTEQLRVGYDTSNYYSTTVGSTGGVTLDAVGSGSAFSFSDNIGAGVSTANIGARIHAVSTTEQLRLGYDTTWFSAFTVASNGQMTIQNGGAGSNRATSFMDDILIKTTDSTIMDATTSTRLLVDGGNGNASIGIGNSAGQANIGFYDNDLGVADRKIANIKTVTQGSGYSDLLFQTANGAGTMNTGLVVGYNSTVTIGLSGAGTTKFGVFEDANAYAAHFFNDGNSTNRKGILVQGGLDDHTAAGPSTLIGFRDGDGTDIGSITFGSSAVAYNTTSDVRLKENIVDTSLGIEDLMKIQIRDYTWKADGEHKLAHGVIAQELYQVYPGAVTVPADDTGWWMVDYSKLTPLVIKAVQDLDFKVKILSSLDTTNTNSLGSLIKQFMESTTNGIGTLFANKVQTKELCLDDVCVTKTQLQQLLNQQNSSNNSGGNPPAGSAPPADDGGGQGTGDTGSPDSSNSGADSGNTNQPTPDEGSTGDTGSGESTAPDSGSSTGGDIPAN